MITRWRCTECYEIVPSAEILTGPDPFRPGEDVSGCPHCKSIESFEPVCDVDGCDGQGTCGWPSPDGYRHTCHKHTGKP